MSHRIHADAALLPKGWSRDVSIEIDASGTIVDVQRGSSAADSERCAGPVIAAMPNVHSHAFQRALAGRTGRASPSHDDSFWSWREAMYAFVERVDPESFGAIAAHAYVEMAKAGYASVAEFHYVHRDPSGGEYDDPAELAARIVDAASTAGLALALLPVFYAHGGFNAVPLGARQRRFAHTLPSFERLYRRLQALAAERRFTLGIAPHSLRAVTADELTEVVRMASPEAPIHIHAAEQTREVDECVASTGERPIEWLLSHAGVDRRWCIVHATHMTEREISALASSEAVAGLAPTTEADLGDGIFAGAAYASAGGRWAIGSDSNTIIDPFAELRQLEWSQRLHLRKRNVMASGTTSTGETLWSHAAKHGAQAIARPTGAIRAGARADLVVLNADDPALCEQAVGDILDAAVFGPCRRPVRDVMAAGRWIVRDGRHANEDDVQSRYRSALRRVWNR